MRMARTLAARSSTPTRSTAMKNPLLALALAVLVAPLAWSALQVGAGQETAAAHPRAR